MAVVLVVDDSAVERRRVRGLVEQTAVVELPLAESLEVICVADGQEALASMNHRLPDVVLTDLQMPGMGGLELVERVRNRYPTVPIVLMTAHGSEEVANEALRRGASSYVPKRNLPRDLGRTIADLFALSRSRHEQERVEKCLILTEHRFVLDNDRSLIAPLVNFLQKTLERTGVCDAADSLRVTVALHEALVNAIEHGNLGVGSEMRETDDSGRQRLLEERRAIEPYRNRRVYVTASQTPNEAAFVIRDQGEGYIPSSLPDPTDPENITRCSGRGLLLMNTFMDEVRHNASGTEVTMIKRRNRAGGTITPGRQSE